MHETTPNLPAESTSSGLDAFATFNYGRSRKMPQVPLEFVVFFGEALLHACAFRELQPPRYSGLRRTNRGLPARGPVLPASQQADFQPGSSPNLQEFGHAPTIVLLNLYRNPQNTAQTADGSHCHVSDVEVQEHYDNFFEEVFTELQEKYGEIEEMNVCDNLGDHLVGNVYVKFRREEDAERAVAELNNRWFNGQAVHAELSPVTDFRESCCRQYEMGECTRGGFCNFMHLRPISRNLRRQLYGRGPRRRSPPRPHIGHRPRERNRRRSPDHRHGRF
ncbi:Splicing Factor U2Af 26 Kda Subunit [Manis pentadactyla]|nr:Splicing Factor U2Af 26 Kda Subunit [Manis pentadactyla]